MCNIIIYICTYTYVHTYINIHSYTHTHIYTIRLDIKCISFVVKKKLKRTTLKFGIWFSFLTGCVHNVPFIISQRETGPDHKVPLVITATEL